jgi:AraC-like DNA-binding protein
MDEIPSPAARIFVDDPEALAGAIQGTILRPVKLSGARGTSEIAQLLMPASSFDFARLATSMLFTGETSDQGYTLIFVLDCPEAARSFSFSTDHTDGYLGFFPPGGNLDAVTPVGFANASLTVAADVFVEAISRQCPWMPEILLARGGIMRIPATDQAPLRRLVAEVHRLIAARSAIFCDPLALRLLEEEVLETFLRAFRAGLEHLLPPPLPRATRREHRLRAAREMIEAHLDAPLSTPDIAATVGLSTRGLEFLFRDFLGLTPALYLRNRRLHAARRMLLHSESRPGLIKEVALAHGFWHLGRFAQTYREFFGEFPSETCGMRIGSADQ